MIKDRMSKIISQNIEYNENAKSISNKRAFRSETEFRLKMKDMA